MSRYRRKGGMRCRSQGVSCVSTYPSFPSSSPESLGAGQSAARQLTKPTTLCHPDGESEQVILRIARERKRWEKLFCSCDEVTTTENRR